MKTELKILLKELKAITKELKEIAKEERVSKNLSGYSKDLLKSEKEKATEKQMLIIMKISELVDSGDLSMNEAEKLVNSATL